MLITKEIEVLLYGMNIKHYKSKGYDIPRVKEKNRNRWKVPRNTKIVVRVEDLARESSVLVTCSCDYCNEVYTRTACKYFDNNEITGKDSCNKCKKYKVKDNYMIKYGTTNFKEISDIVGFKLGRNKIDGNIVYNHFIEKGLIPQFTPEEYTDCKATLPFLCSHHLDKGYIWINYDNLNNGDRGCKYCGIDKRNEDKRYSYDFVKSKFEEKNYTLLSLIYKHCDDELEFICNEHPDEGIQTTTLWSVLEYNHSCKICRYQQTSDENHWNWQGGIGLERDKIKQTQEYKDWRISIFQKDNYTCQCCGIKGAELNAHHLYNFADYPDLRMDVNNGISLCLDCHSVGKKGSFHNTFGTRHNTPEQLQEYIARFKNGEFNDLRLLNKL